MEIRLMAERAYRYGDPAMVVEIDQERERRKSCEGCRHFDTLWGVKVCKRDHSRRNITRCRHYQLKEME